MAATAPKLAPDTHAPGLAGLKARYLETVHLMERLHKQFLELVQTMLDEARIDDINSVQALILHAIGRDEVLIGDLIQRGYYQGTNVSYNVRRLVEAGYLTQTRSPHDRRAIKIRLTPKGLGLCARLDQAVDDQVRELDGAAMLGELAHASGLLKRLSGFWTRVQVERDVP
jgi:DNA-binding MarR family transcriptional regulator